MKLLKISLLLGSVFFSVSSVRADKVYILCPAADQINFFKQDGDSWKATGESDNYKFTGALAFKRGVYPQPSEVGPLKPTSQKGPTIDLSCIYRGENMKSGLKITAVIRDGPFTQCTADFLLKGFMCIKK